MKDEAVMARRSALSLAALLSSATRRSQEQ